MFLRPLIATTTLLAIAALFYLTVAATASHCPIDMADIDAALPSAEISAEEREKVMTLRNQGEQLHEDGNHAEAVKVLAEAKQILGIE